MTQILYQAISQKDKMMHIQYINSARNLHQIDALSMSSSYAPCARDPRACGWPRREPQRWGETEGMGVPGGGAEGRGRGGMLIRERWRDRDYCALLYSTWLEKRSTPSILNPPVPHTNTQTAHREQQIDPFFLIKGKGSGLCAMPAHSKH